MSSAIEVYEKARKLAEACFKSRQAMGLDPYLPVLDTLIENYPIKKTRTLPTQEILTSRIVGTKHKARTESFAWNFMPLLEPDSEFAAKWVSLYKSTQEEGLRDPIKVYEIYGRYFVEEGNKRVSVTKYDQNPLIMASITQIIVDAGDDENAKLYEEHLKFFELTGINAILMSTKKNYTRMLKLLGVDEDHSLSAEQRKNILSLFFNVEKAYEQLRQEEDIRALSGDAFLIFLETYGTSGLESAMSYNAVLREMEAIWPDIALWPDKSESALMDESTTSEKKKFLSGIFKEPVKAAFIESQCAESSSWTAMHAQGIEYLKEQLKDDVEVSVYDQANTPEEIQEALEKAVKDGNEVIFTTNPLMLQATSRFAAMYPKIRFLNCSLNPDVKDMRTYYARSYEVRFLMGLVAGMLTKTGHIGYIADFPIYGEVADINAFAIGACMTRPSARIYLDWSTTQSATLQDYPMDVDILYAAGQDFDPRVLKGKKFGLFNVGEGKFYNLAAVHINWGVFYVRIVKSILNNTYKADARASNSESINYWLGFSNGMLDIEFTNGLPIENRRLIHVFKAAMADKSFYIFGDIHKDEYKRSLTLEDLVKMDWLLDNISGTIPTIRQLTSEAEQIVSIHGMEGIKDEDEDENPEDEPAEVAETGEKELKDLEPKQPKKANQAAGKEENADNSAVKAGDAARQED